MRAAKDEPAVVRFLALFAKLKGTINDNPRELETLAAEDEWVKKLCLDLNDAATPFQISERSQRELYVAPADPRFIEAWRDYEQRYGSAMAGIFLTELGQDLSSVDDDRRDEFTRRKESARELGAERATAIEAAIDFAAGQVDQDWREFPDEFAEAIEEAVWNWRRLPAEVGFSLADIFRRRELVPVVMVPRHVASQHGSAEPISLFTHLQQAQEAFIFGTPYASLALMRSVLEMLLQRHYRSTGNNLKDLINNARLPKDVDKSALHSLRMLANDVLHEARRPVPDEEEFERRLLGYLASLRVLIERAPSH